MSEQVPTPPKSDRQVAYQAAQEKAYEQVNVAFTIPTFGKNILDAAVATGALCWNDFADSEPLVIVYEAAHEKGFAAGQLAERNLYQQIGNGDTMRGREGQVRLDEGVFVYFNDPVYVRKDEEF